MRRLEGSQVTLRLLHTWVTCRQRERRLCSVKQSGVTTEPEPAAPPGWTLGTVLAVGALGAPGLEVGPARRTNVCIRAAPSTPLAGPCLDPPVGAASEISSEHDGPAVPSLQFRSSPDPPPRSRCSVPLVCSSRLAPF